MFIYTGEYNSLVNMNKSDTAPAVFVSHGAPTFALEPGELGPQLVRLAARFAAPAAVLAVSAHWQTRGVKVSTALQPDTIHDFGGFPKPLYQLQYPAPGAPELARAAVRLVAGAGFDSGVDVARGLDHGVWVPLRYLYPDASVPVFQVSMPLDLDPAAAVRLGAALAPLRRQGVLILGSGSLTHNLGDVRFDSAPASGYAVAFAAWIRERLRARDLPALIDYRRLAPHAARAHPTEEHLLPLLVALGASAPDDEFTTMDGGITYGALSMDSYAWRAPAGSLQAGHPVGRGGPVRDSGIQPLDPRGPEERD